ncbi:carboxylesterase/lipase family protein [Oceanicola sp. 22II-s10i]|uniref:carboxylesterase/lipase family protein n=1 Tax=Oceanicola sp. 22II-s10i TaxID=1317116 RepID=UPI001595AEF5|nr:carboxylesterase family protein [Oceanicola sp. 22II-s10i]
MNTLHKTGNRVQTTEGPIDGIQGSGAIRFLGVPYAVADRFGPARRPKAWNTPFSAHRLGDRCPQTPGRGGGSWMSFLSDTSPMSEDCLRLNVYVPDRPATKPRPVMVWFHGGGFISGSGGRNCVDGSRMADRGDVVVITLNHRLNAFGFTYLAELMPGHEGINCGVTDLVAALEWVRDNAAAFGGDAGNVTIFGQSGGGGKVAALMAMPSAEGLFHRAVIQSASTLLTMATPERATACAKLMLEELGIKNPTPEALAKPTTQEVLAARLRAVARNGGVDDFRPVVDGTVMPANPFEPESLERSAKIPLLIGVCEDEITFFLASADPEFHKMEAETAKKRIAHFIGIEAAEGGKVFDAIAAMFPGESPAQIASRAMSEQMYRRNDRLAADIRSAHPGAAPTYSYLFRWKTAALNGHLACPHTFCIPMVFGTTESASELLGRPREARALSDKAQDAWLAFARTGDPNTDSLPAWRPYNAGDRPTMIFDDTCGMMDDPMPELRTLFETLPAYSTDKGSGATQAAI